MFLRTLAFTRHATHLHTPITHNLSSCCRNISGLGFRLSGGDSILKRVEDRNPNEPEFVQAFAELSDTVVPVLERDDRYRGVLYYLSEPERVVKFRVAWVGDDGGVNINRGYRVQYSSVLGPYKGGLRFHPSVTESVIKFLGLEQTFKNALTGLNMGGAKGGSDFDPKGKSDQEIMRFCQAFMTELSRHIGATRDVPAGDIGVGGREIGYLFGQFRRLTNKWEGALTGKDVGWGGSPLRPEATGYGAVYMAREILADMKRDMKGMRCVVTGSGNVALYLCEKLVQLGAVPLTVSDSNGWLYKEEGFNADDLAILKRGKEEEHKRLANIAVPRATYHEKHPEKHNSDGDHNGDNSGDNNGHDAGPYDVPADLVFPCATQNEITRLEAQAIVQHNRCLLVVEGANMPTDPVAMNLLARQGIVIAPAKAANAGGVAVSGLEMAQNFAFTQWDRQDVDRKLQHIMRNIFLQAKMAAVEYDLIRNQNGNTNDLKNYKLTPLSLVHGANIAGFTKVAKTIIQMGY